MFPVNSNPATVLFDSSASNSFISSKFVAQYNIPKIVMKWKMIVQSPRGELLSRHVCPNISISIRGVDFLAHLIVLESKGIDIILGMDWLTKHDGIIGCARKVIQLRHPDGTKVEYQAEAEATERIQLNQANVVEELKVVSDFPDVFPEELPGMPLDREIEFSIELVPSTEPIYKRPYRMDANQLAELKNQIQDLLDKGYICPSSSP
jgi:hypothetical protein